MRNVATFLKRRPALNGLLSRFTHACAGLLSRARRTDRETGQPFREKDGRKAVPVEEAKQPSPFLRFGVDQDGVLVPILKRPNLQEEHHGTPMKASGGRPFAAAGSGGR